MQPILYVLLLFNILFNFGGVEGREASPGSLAIPSACHMVRPSFQQQEWFREKGFWRGSRSHDRCIYTEQSVNVAQKAK